MKIFVFAAVALGAVLFPAYPDSSAPGIVTADNVNVRAEPNIRSEIVGQVHQDQPVEVIAMDGEWCAIVPPPGLAGWVSAEYLKEGVVAGARVNVRAGPGVAYATLGKFQQGDRPEVLETKESWVKVVLPRGARVWLNSRLVRLGEGVASIPRLSPSPVPEAVGSPEMEIASSPSAPPPIAAIAVPTPEQVVVSFPAPGENAPVSAPTPPAPASVVSGTPFLPRSASSISPQPGIAPVKSYLGLLRELKQPYTSGTRRVTHELVRFEQRSEVIGHLAAGTFDLSKYQNRKVRLWAEVVPEEDPIPLLEVKGIQIMW